MTVTNPYATVADVQALLNTASGTGITIGTASVPTTSQVEGFLDQTAAEVDSILRARGYGTVPADGANDILMIRRFVAEKAAAETWLAGYGGFDEPTARVKEWLKDYDDFLKRLIASDQRLIDQAPRQGLNVVLARRYRG
jgi:hypothetical protein